MAGPCTRSTLRLRPRCMHSVTAAPSCGANQALPGLFGPTGPHLIRIMSVRVLCPNGRLSVPYCPLAIAPPNAKRVHDGFASLA